VITKSRRAIDEVVEFREGARSADAAVSIQAKIIFVDRQDVEQLRHQIRPRLDDAVLQPPDSAAGSADRQTGDTDLDACPMRSSDGNFPSNENIVSRAGTRSRHSARGRKSFNPALDLIFSTAIGNFDLTAFLQALQSVELADVQAEPTITTLDNRQAEILVGDRVPIRVIDVSAVNTGGGSGQAVPRATVQFEQPLSTSGHAARDGKRQILMEVHAERSNVRPASGTSGFTFRRSRRIIKFLSVTAKRLVIGGLTVTESR